MIFKGIVRKYSKRVEFSILKGIVKVLKKGEVLNKLEGI